MDNYEKDWPMKEKEWRKVKPKKNICERLETQSCGDSLSTEQTSLTGNDAFPRLAVDSELILQSILIPELINVITQLDLLYLNFRRHEQKENSWSFPTSQFYEENLEDVIDDVCPNKFQKRCEKCLLTGILCDYDHHRHTIKSLMDIYYQQFNDNVWNMGKTMASVITFILFRIFKENMYKHVYNLLINIVPVYRLLPLIHFLMSNKTRNNIWEIGIKIDEDNYVKKMFTVNTNRGYMLMKKLLNDLLKLYYEKYPDEISHKRKKLVPFIMEEYLEINRDDFLKQQKQPSVESELALNLHDIDTISEAIEVTPSSIGPLIQYQRMADLCLEDGIIQNIPKSLNKYPLLTKEEKFEKHQMSEPIKKKSIFSAATSVKKKGDQSLPVELTELRSTTRKEIMETVQKYSLAPWSLTREEKEIMLRLEMEPEWYKMDNYPDVESGTDKGIKKYGMHQRRILELTGEKNRCCMQEIEDISKDTKDVFPPFKTDKTAIKYLKKEVDFRKNNACILREAAAVNKEEMEMLSKLNELEGGEIGLLQFKKKMLERELEDESEKAVALKRNRILALLTLEKALLARKVIQQKNMEQRMIYKEVQLVLEEKKKEDEEEDFRRKKETIRDVQYIREKAQENINTKRLDNWIEAQHLSNELNEMKQEYKQELEDKMNKKKKILKSNKLYEDIKRRENELEHKNSILKEQNSAAAKLEKEMHKLKENEEMKRKKEAAFNLNTRRKCLRKTAEDYVTNRRILWQEQKESEAVKKSTVNKITVKSKELDELQQQLEIFRHLRAKENPLTKQQLSLSRRPTTHKSVAPIIDDCVCDEKSGLVFRKIREPLQVDVKSQDIDEIKEKLNKLKPHKKVILPDERDVFPKILVETAPPVTSLNTFFTQLMKKIKWKEGSISNRELMRLKAIVLGELYLEKKLFKENIVIPDTTEIPPPEVQKPAFLGHNLSANVFKHEEGLVIKKPLHPKRLIIPQNVLDAITDVLRLYSSIRKETGRKRTEIHKLTIFKSLINIFKMGTDISEDESIDMRYFQNRRAMMLPAELVPDDLKEFPSESGDEDDNRTIRSKFMRRARPTIFREPKDVQTRERKKSIKKPRHKVLPKKKAVQKFIVSSESQKEVEDDDSANLIESSEEIVSEPSDDIFKLITDDKGLGEIHGDILQNRFKDLIDNLDLPIKYLTLSAIRTPSDVSIEQLGEKMWSLKKKQLSKLIETEPEGELETDEPIQIPSSTALEYILKMHDDELSSSRKDEVVVEVIKATSIIKKEVKFVVDKYRKVVRKYRKRSPKQLSKIPEVKKTYKPIRYMLSDPNDFIKRHILRKRTQSELYRPKDYPPYKLEGSATDLANIGIHPQFRIRGDRIIIPGYCRILQQKDIYKYKPKLSIRALQPFLIPSFQTKALYCMRKKFNEIEKLLNERFPPPQNKNKLILEYFPSLADDKRSATFKFAQLIEKRRDKMFDPLGTKNELSDDDEISFSVAPTFESKKKDNKSITELNDLRIKHLQRFQKQYAAKDSYENQNCEQSESFQIMDNQKLTPRIKCDITEISKDYNPAEDNLVKEYSSTFNIQIQCDDGSVLSEEIYSIDCNKYFPHQNRKITSPPKPTTYSCVVNKLSTELPNIKMSNPRIQRQVIDNKLPPIDNHSSSHKFNTYIQNKSQDKTLKTSTTVLPPVNNKQ